MKRIAMVLFATLAFVGGMSVANAQMHGGAHGGGSWGGGWHGGGWSGGGWHGGYYGGWHGGCCWNGSHVVIGVGFGGPWWGWGWWRQFARTARSTAASFSGHGC